MEVDVPEAVVGRHRDVGVSLQGAQGRHGSPAERLELTAQGVEAVSVLFVAVLEFRHGFKEFGHVLGEVADVRCHPAHLGI